MLTNKQLKELWSDLTKYNVTIAQVAKSLGVSETAVYNILNGKTKKAHEAIKQMIEMRNDAKTTWLNFLNSTK
jgi:plasmid maintenance system antidote protein VapI